MMPPSMSSSMSTSMIDRSYHFTSYSSSSSSSHYSSHHSLPTHSLAPSSSNGQYLSMNQVSACNSSDFPFLSACNS